MSHVQVLPAGLTRDLKDDLEYMDDNAERLGRKKMRTDAMKRQFAINGNFQLNFVHLKIKLLQIMRKLKRFSQLAFTATAKTILLPKPLLSPWELGAIFLARQIKS